ncbi:MAG: biopolymer transporter ExbD [Acidobacteria bacterium]|jgi:biopolymer transport protein ExbD|nr:biopolymer transporter ExbD [Acidobacteriota bacterium]
MGMTAGSGPSNPQLNVTPLIDVLLVLIIIFMVIVTQQKRTGLEAEIPQPATDKTTQPPAERTIVIQLEQGNGNSVPSLKINQEEVNWSDLQDRLQRVFALRAERVAFVRGDDNIDFQYVADTIDIARAAGVEKVGLLGKKQ